MKVTWDPSMSTGVDTIDQQHKQLISWLNELYDAMQAGKGRDQIGPLLDKLGQYVGMHFKHEEECMAKYKCPVAAQNIAAHKGFVETFGQFRREFETGGANVALVLKVQKELMGWLTGHIKGVDTKLQTCVR